MHKISLYFLVSSWHPVVSATFSLSTVNCQMYVLLIGFHRMIFLSILNIIVISILGENLKRNLKNLEMKKS